MSDVMLMDLFELFLFGSVFPKIVCESVFLFFQPYLSAPLSQLLHCTR